MIPGDRQITPSDWCGEGRGNHPALQAVNAVPITWMSHFFHPLPSVPPPSNVSARSFVRFVSPDSSLAFCPAGPANRRLLRAQIESEACQRG